MNTLTNQQQVRFDLVKTMLEHHSIGPSEGYKENMVVFVDGLTQFILEGRDAPTLPPDTPRTT